MFNFDLIQHESFLEKIDLMVLTNLYHRKQNF